MEGINVPDEKTIESLQVKKGFKYLGKLHVDIVKGQGIKEKSRKNIKEEEKLWKRS